jgi:hypothetical protein
MQRPPHHLSSLTRRLSELLASDQGARVLGLMQKIGLMAAQPARPGGQPPSQPEAAPPFGIWRPDTRADGTKVYARRAELSSEWRCWADLPEIAVARTRKRVVLVGESVARGFLYDPVVTPAKVLARMLSVAGGPQGADEIEVIDLARIDITATELSPVFSALRALAPDVIVLFAGNNWHNLPRTPLELERLVAAFATDGYPGHVKEVYRAAIRDASAAAMNRLAEVASAIGAKVAVIVPEFNLKEWRNEAANQVPVLPGDRHGAWMVARQQADRALDEGDLDRVAQLADTMIGLDDGTSAVSQTLRAEVHLRRGALDQARAALEAARDAPVGTVAFHSPRCASFVQEVLRERSRHHGFAVVDLPRVFQAHAPDDLPGRRLFLDYCHLSFEGIALAMAATARAVSPWLGLAPAAVPDTVPPRDVGLTPRSASIAELLAAIHNAHYGQGLEIISYWCKRALRTWPEVADVMVACVDFHARRAPHWMCRSFEAAMSDPMIARYLYNPDPRGFQKLAGFALWQSVIGALREHGADSGAKQLEDMLAREHGTAARVDLMEPCYRARSYREARSFTFGPPRAFLQAHATTSVFHLVRSAPGDTTLSLTWRLPSGRGDDSGRAGLVVTINGRQVFAAAPAHGWTCSSFHVEASSLRAGVNTIEIHWPAAGSTWAARIAESQLRLELGVLPDVLPTFGEIFSFTAAQLDTGTALA